ncbi:MAG: hypothetical protein D6762_02470 [Candidatus Neomarinimicrobiota bacterium]|nr:MAG: hypothetical protein D6762_02470 [Candidatus Neomarinimicrobiota bacterium]
MSVHPEDRQEIKDTVFRLLSYRLRSVQELRQRLTQKGYGAEVVQSVLKELQSKGYLDDRKFGRAFIHDQIHLKHAGPHLIRKRLAGFGIPGALIESLVQEACSPSVEEELIRYWLNKKKIRVEDLDYQSRGRVSAFLTRKGFSSELVREMLQPK